jgi:3-hydroxybutyryl-CoA dehydrogenase
MANELTSSPTLRLPEELAQEFKRRELAALMRPRAVGVCGTGTVARQLAFRMAERGMRVSLVADGGTPPTSLLSELEHSLSRIPGDASAAGRVSVVDHFVDLRGHELIVDAQGDLAPLQDRYAFYRKVLAAVDSDTPIAVVTAGLPEALHLETFGPSAGRVVPVRLPLAGFSWSVVEVIKAPFVHRASIVRAHRVFDATGVVVARVPAIPGMVVDRLLLAVVNEACRMLEDGLSDIETIDRLYRLHSLHGLGPLQTADIIGIDVLHQTAVELAHSTGQRRYKPARLLRAYVEQGYLGLKSGRGFYQYSSGRT